MVKLIVLFRHADSLRHDYNEQYNNFLIQLDRLPGVRRKEVNNVYAGPGGFAPFHAVVEVVFDSQEDLQAALASEAGREAGVTLIHFAGTDSITLFTEVLEETYQRKSKKSVRRS